MPHIVHKLALFDELETWEERYQYVMDLGAELEIQPENFKQPERRVHGCQSRVWLEVDFDSEVCQLTVESDALLVRGLLHIFKLLVDGKTAEEVLSLELNVPKKIGLEGKLSITRLNGIAAVQTAIQRKAVERLQNHHKSSDPAGHPVTPHRSPEARSVST